MKRSADTTPTVPLKQSGTVYSPVAWLLEMLCPWIVPKGLWRGFGRLQASSAPPRPAGVHGLELDSCLSGYLLESVSIPVDHISSNAPLEEGIDEAFDVHGSVQQLPRVAHTHRLRAH